MTPPIPERVAWKAATRFKRTPDGCHESTFTPNQTFPVIGWVEDGRHYSTRIQNAAWVFHHDQQLPPRSRVHRTCGNPKCVNREHLLLIDPNTFKEFKQWQQRHNRR